ncbi:unnamed protein product [Parnassius apollo]|uniref:(apollo) hypothetical protein n=1 Tax=Parnassius apollo TaxID=110799 RepID=A0A8S3XCJ8_PARAO|nr:unnamed protein product [Parnassius apollo]
MEKEIKPEELIPLVHERAVLWDKTLNDYKNNNLKLLAWREICTILIPNFENMEEKERQHFVARPNPPQESVASRISQPGTEGSTQLSENSQPSTSKRQKTMPPQQHIMDLDVKMS